jgi:DNA-binding transcriptional MerR regulator
MEWLQHEKGDIASLTEEKLSIYNQALKEQVLELEDEIAELPHHPRYQPVVSSNGPFEVRVRTDGPQEARWIDQDIQKLEARLRRLRGGKPLKEVRSIIDAYRDDSPEFAGSNPFDF